MPYSCHSTTERTSHRVMTEKKFLVMLNGAAPQHIFHVAHAHCLGAGCVCLCGAKSVSACSYHWARNHHVGFERVGCKLQPRSPPSRGSQQLGQMENSNAGMFSVHLAFFVSITRSCAKSFACLLCSLFFCSVRLFALRLPLN